MPGSSFDPYREAERHEKMRQKRYMAAVNQRPKEQVVRFHDPILAKAEVMTPPVVLSELDDTLREMRLRGADKATGVRWEAYQALLDESRRLHAAMAAGDEVLPASVEQMYLNAIGQNKAESMRRQIMGQSQLSSGGTLRSGVTTTSSINEFNEFTSTQAVVNAPRTSAVLWLDQEVGRVRAKGRTALSTL